jgi:hypothetical protein
VGSNRFENLLLPEGFQFQKIQFPLKIDNAGRAVSPNIPGHNPDGTSTWACGNPIYKYAREQLLVFNPEVMTIRIPRAIGDDSNELAVLDEAWVANLCWRNIPDKQLNPKCNLGFFRALMGYAAQPIWPEFGWVITEPLQ